jgi:hypothetical protein
MAAIFAAEVAHPAFQIPSTTSHENDLRAQVWRILAGIYPLEPERRDGARFPYPRLIRLLPLATDDQPTSRTPTTVVGKHLSEDGLGFFHTQPLLDRHMLAQLELPGGGMATFEIALRWCRFIRDGWYESGAKLVRVVAAT